eukprot:12652567-Alexandrium_andersonii.AAC.1
MHPLGGGAPSRAAPRASWSASAPRSRPPILEISGLYRRPRDQRFVGGPRHPFCLADVGPE